MTDKWRVETLDVESNKVIFDIDIVGGGFTIVENQRDVSVNELNKIHSLVVIMSNLKYTKVESTKLP